MTPSIGDKVTFYDERGKPNEAWITAIHPLERGRGVWHGEAFHESEEFELAPERVDLVYGPDGKPLDPATARHRFSVLHKSQQRPPADGPLEGILSNYWT